MGEIIDNDVTKFVFEKLPKAVFKELPNKLIDVTKDVHEFLKDKVVDKVVDVSKDIGEGTDIIPSFTLITESYYLLGYFFSILCNRTH